MEDARLAVETGVDGLDVVIGTSSFLREHSHGKDMAYITKTALEVIEYIKSKGLEVRCEFTILSLQALSKFHIQPRIFPPLKSRLGIDSQNENDCPRNDGSGPEVDSHVSTRNGRRNFLCSNNCTCCKI